MDLDLIGQILVIIAKSDSDEAIQIQYFAEWKIGTGLSAPSMKRMHRHARQQVRDHKTSLVAFAVVVRRYASAKVLVSAESALHAAATSKRKTLEE